VAKASLSRTLLGYHTSIIILLAIIVVTVKLTEMCSYNMQPDLGKPNFWAQANFLIENVKKNLKLIILHISIKQLLSLLFEKNPTQSFFFLGDDDYISLCRFPRSSHI